MTEKILRQQYKQVLLLPKEEYQNEHMY